MEFMKSTFITRIILVLAGLALAGCSTLITNLTPARLQQNPSGIYRLGFEADFHGIEVIPNSARAEIVVNGETFKMTRVPDLKRDIFEFEYRMPEGVRSVKYYYVLKYRQRVGVITKEVERYSTEFTEGNQPFESVLANRYVVQLESTRGPVGARVAILGRGFSEFDRVVLGDEEIPTNFESVNALSFTVPGLPAGESYPVFLRTGEGDLPAGRFHIDPAQMSVLPASLQLAVGDSEMMLFRIFFEAPGNGLPISVTTDAPASIIMPEVKIPAQAQSVNVPVEGGEPGRGVLFVEAPGFETVRVPFTVTDGGTALEPMN
jgi:hypothetical protein